MEILSLTPKEIELHNKLNKVGEMILQYFRTREYERLYMAKDHELYGITWIFSDLDNEVATKITISYKEHACSHNQAFDIKYNDDVILSGKVYVDTSKMSLHWNTWCRFVTIDLNKNAGECTNYFNDEPRYPGLVDQKDLIKILNIVSQELGVLIVTAVQKTPEEPKEIALNEGATVNDVIGSDVLNKPTDHVFAFHGRQVKLTECVAAPSRYGLIDPKTKQVNAVAHLIYRAFAYAIDEINKEYDVSISNIPDIQEITWEWLFAYKNNDGDICLACTEHIMRGNVDHYELWYRSKGIKHVFMRLVVDNPGHITVYEGDRNAVTIVSARTKVKVKALVDEYNNQKKPEEPEELKKIAEEHDKEVLSEFCNTLKEFSEEYADIWLINKFNKLIGVLKNYCSEINQIDRYKKSTVRISYDWCYMFNRNLLPPVTMAGDRYSYDYNPTSFKIFDMYDSNGDLMVKVDHETFEINFYFYHSATEPFLTISANDYMGHVKHSYHDSHNHMDEFKFKYLTSLLKKELKIQIINPFADPVIVDHTWKDTDLVSEIIEGSSVVNDTWKNPDPINTTNFKGVKAMDLKTLRTIVLSWMSQYTTDDEMATISITHPTNGIRYRITMKDCHFNERSIYIQDDPKNNTFTIHNGGYGFPFTVITISGSDDISVEFNDKAYFKTFNKTELLMLFNMICIELGSNVVSAFTPPSVANIVNRYGNMSASPRYEVKNSYQLTDGSTVITDLNLLSMNIMKPKDFSGAYVVPGCSRIIPRIKSILFNEKKKVTTIIWNDDTKTMAKCTGDDDYDEEIGVAICIAKKYYDNNQNQMRKEINKFKARQKKHETAVQKRLDKKNKVTEIIDNKPNEVKVDDNTDNIIG